MKIKLNWGFGIFAFYLTFMAVILGFVFWSTGLKPDLVAKDYYQQELEYQNQIDKKERLSNLDGDFSYKITNMSLNLEFPEALNQKVKQGEVTLFRPSDASLDNIIKFNSKENNLELELNNLKGGIWILKIEWETNGKTYYFEDKFRIE